MDKKGNLIVLGCSHDYVRRERAISAARYIGHNKDKFGSIIFSGGLGQDGETEAQNMKQIVEKYLHDIEIILEDTSKTTQENISCLEEKGIVLDGSTIISSASHLQRVKKLLHPYDRVELVSSESILRPMIQNPKTHTHDIMFTLYEVFRPVAKYLPQGFISRGKNLIKKS